MSFDFLVGSEWEDAIALGNTYMRLHIRWGFHIDTPLNTDMQAVASNLVSYGVCTMIGNGSETPPSPRTASGDLAPPLERWIYWETLAPRLVAVNEAAGVMVWEASASTEATQTKGMVNASALPEGDTLNLWSSWDVPADFADSFGANQVFWHSMSILRKE